MKVHTEVKKKIKKKLLNEISLIECYQKPNAEIIFLYIFSFSIIFYYVSIVICT